jgi:hypothetical protein
MNMFSWGGWHKSFQFLKLKFKCKSLFFPYDKVSRIAALLYKMKFQTIFFLITMFSKSKQYILQCTLRYDPEITNS